MKRWNFPLARVVLTFVIPFAFYAILVPFFGPEIPHLGLFGFTFVLSGVATISSFVHNSRICSDVGFVNDDKIDNRAKIERLKLRHGTYFDLVKMLSTAFVAISGIVFFSSHELFLKFTENRIAAWRFYAVATVQMLFLTTFFLIGTVGELMKGMSEVEEQLSNVHVRS